MDPRRALFVSVALAIVGFGVVMVYSASITSWPSEFDRVYVGRQLLALAVGLFAGCLCACVPAEAWKRAAVPLLFLTIVLLAAVLVPGLGARVNGARRWLRVGGLQFQPSELAKIAVPLFLCARLQQGGGNRAIGKSTILWLLGPVLLTATLVVVEPDLGTGVFLLSVAMIALFVAGWPLERFAAGALCAVPAAGLLAVLRPYQLRRLAGFAAGWADSAQMPYQLDQSLVSIGAGGLCGVGLGKGWQKLSFLPEANTDFVFAVIGEELGLLGTLGLLVLWGVLYFAGLRLVRDVRRDPFRTAAAFMLLTQIGLQALANMAVVTALVPPKGIPLPLVSYGGSALVMSLASLGILLSLTDSKRFVAEPIQSIRPRSEAR